MHQACTCSPKIAHRTHKDTCRDIDIAVGHILATVWLLYVRKEKKEKGDRAITLKDCRRHQHEPITIFPNIYHYCPPKKGNSDTKKDF